MTCQQPRCTHPPPCRRLAHNGFRAGLVRCPSCSYEAHLAEIGVKPNRAQGVAGTHSDWRHAVGVQCCDCHHYFIPEDAPQALLSDAQPWELPRTSRALTLGEMLDAERAARRTRFDRTHAPDLVTR